MEHPILFVIIACCIMLLVGGIAIPNVWLIAFAIWGFILCWGIISQRRPPQ